LGAGASKVFGIPTMRDFLNDFESFLNNNNDDKYAKLDIYNDIKKYLGDKDEFDLESVLTVVDDISNISQFMNRFNHPSIRYLLNKYSQSDTISGYTKYEKSDTAISLRDELNNYIKIRCTPTSREIGFKAYDEFFEVLYPMILKNGRRGPNSGLPYCPIFTTNYDLCLELYCKERNIRFENGQGMSNNKLVVDISRTNENLYNENYFKIFKLHGSINWYKIKDTDIRELIEWHNVNLNPGDETLESSVIEKEIMIYPLFEKQIYNDPFSDMFFKLKETLESSDDWFIIGYSLRDKEIRDIFKDSIFSRIKRGKGTKIFIIDPLADKIVSKAFGSFKDSNLVEFIDIAKKFGDSAKDVRMQIGKLNIIKSLT
jgi:hypothetical protein